MRHKQDLMPAKLRPSIRKFGKEGTSQPPSALFVTAMARRIDFLHEASNSNNAALSRKPHVVDDWKRAIKMEEREAKKEAIVVFFFFFAPRRRRH